MKRPSVGKQRTIPYFYPLILVDPAAVMLNCCRILPSQTVVIYGIDFSGAADAGKKSLCRKGQIILW